MKLMETRLTRSFVYVLSEAFRLVLVKNVLGNVLPRSRLGFPKVRFGCWSRELKVEMEAGNSLLNVNWVAWFLNI